ncbi:MAG: hypothetical protein WC595_01535 [Candidatus Nanoarchaeia archaeon]
MNNNPRAQVIEWYKIAEGRVSEIGSGHSPNWIVERTGWFDITLKMEPVPLEDRTGLYVYYSALRDGLNAALKGGSISQELSDILSSYHPPKEVKALFNK